MSTLEQRLYLGDRAKEVIENEVFVDAFTQIQNEVIEQWTNSPARDAEGRERLWTYLQMLKRLQAQLQQTMESGQLARIDLEHKRTLVDRARGMFSSPG
jgi:hypothetical protein